MEYNNFSDTFCDILPIIYKASPLIGSLVGSPVTGVIVGLLASLVGGNACNHEEIAKMLKEDPDLYAKLSKLDCTHGEWLRSLKSS